MKKIYTVLLLFLCGTMFISCNDWLDVNPRSQVKSKVLYETQDGFKMALNGVYIKLASADLYGQKTSMYIPDALARMWSYPTDKTSLLRGLSTHDYTISNVENEFSAMFSNYYNAIAQLNDLLYNLETSSITFEYNNDKLLKAEAMGLRAIYILTYCATLVPFLVMQKMVMLPFLM